MAGNAAQTSREMPAKISFLAAGRRDGLSDLEIVERVDRRAIDDRNDRQRLHELRKDRTPHAVARGRGEDDRQFQGLGRFGQRHHVVLQLSRGIVANPGHEADLVVNEDERGVFRCQRFVGAAWLGHDILLQKER
jgi:hypothetical protein